MSVFGSEALKDEAKKPQGKRSDLAISQEPDESAGPPHSPRTGVLP